MADGWVKFVPEKKVFHLISSNGFYGAENVLLELCRGLQASSAFSPVVGLLNSGNRGHLPLLRACRKHGIEWKEFTCQGRFDNSLIREVKTFINENNIRIIHSHGYKSNFYTYCVRQPDLVLVSTCHNWIVTGMKMRCFTWLDKLLLRRFNDVVCVSRPVQDELQRWRINNKRLSLIYNGIDIDRFQKNKENKVRNQLGIADSDIVIGFVGRISKEKGVHLLMECAKVIHEEFPEIRLVFVGDGPSRSELESKKADSVIFTGVQSDIPSYYDAFDIFVLSSFTEGLPMVILEAMASGLPVVASDVGSIPDVVVDGQTGLLVRPGSKGDLVDALEKLIGNPARAREMGANGRKRVEQSFSSEKMVREYMAMYNSLTQLFYPTK